MHVNSKDKKELIAEIYDLALDKNVDGKAFYYLMEAVAELLGQLGK